MKTNYCARVPSAGFNVLIPLGTLEQALADYWEGSLSPIELDGYDQAFEFSSVDDGSLEPESNMGYRIGVSYNEDALGVMFLPIPDEPCNQAVLDMTRTSFSAYLNKFK